MLQLSPGGNCIRPAATFAGWGFTAPLQHASPDPGAGALGQKIESCSKLLTSTQNDGEFRDTAEVPGGAQEDTAAVGLSLWSTAETATRADFPMASPAGGTGRTQRSRSSLMASPELPEALRSFWLWLCTPSLLWVQGTGWSAALSLAPGGDKAQATAPEGT